jgi:hypothetical protein
MSFYLRVDQELVFGSRGRITHPKMTRKYAAPVIRIKPEPMGVVSRRSATVLPAIMNATIVEIPKKRATLPKSM